MLVIFADDEPRGDIECGIHRWSYLAVTSLCVRRSVHARHHRQDRLLAIECLDLAFLIDAEDYGSVRWGQV